jgi:hypothetical protein
MIKKNESYFESWLIFIPFLGAFLFLLFLDPFYFLQDDNYSQFYPILSNGLENFYHGKGFPTFCMYPYSGLPTVSYSTYPFFYPILHVSYGIASGLLKTPFHLLTVYSFIHFLIGYFFVYRILKSFQATLWWSMAGALMFVFCGFNLIATRSWYYVAPTIAFLPLIFFLLHSGKRKLETWKDFWLLSFVFTLYLYSGNFQFWCYTLLFVLIYFLWKQNKSKRNVWVVLGAIGFSLVLFLPQALATHAETSSLHRADPAGWGIWYSILPVLGLPFQGAIPNGWGSPSLRNTDAQFYHGGGLLIAAALLFFFFRFVNARGKWSAWLLAPQNGWLICFLVAILFSLGRTGGLWILHSNLPVVSSFAHPFKFLLYVQFFGILIGMRFLNVYFRKNQFVHWGFLVYFVFYFGWHLHASRQAFYLYSYSEPYAKPVWQKYMDSNFQGRIAPINLGRSEENGFEQAMGLNFCVPYKQLSIEGYENLNAGLPDYYKNHREWGVGYFLLYKHKGDLNAWGIVQKEFKKYQANVDTVFENENFLLLKNDTCSSMVELLNSANQPLACQYELMERADGVDVLLKTEMKNAKAIMINFVWRPAFKAYTDGLELPVQADSYGRILVKLKSSTHKIELRYEPFPI